MIKKKKFCKLSYLSFIAILFTNIRVAKRTHKRPRTLHSIVETLFEPNVRNINIIIKSKIHVYQK